MARLTGHQPVNPWCAIFSTSVATAGLSGSSVGPVQLTGTTSSSPHRATSDPSARSASICAVGRRIPVATEEIQAMTRVVSWLIGLVNRTLECLTREGNCHTCPLLPPSSRCSMSTWAASPSHPLKFPRLSPSMVSLKNTVEPGSLLVVIALRSVGPRVAQSPDPFPVHPQLRPQQPRQRADQPPRELV